LSAKKKAPDIHPKPFDPNANLIRVIVDVLWHDDSRAVLKGPVTSQALKTMAVQRERMQGGKAGEDSHRKFNAGWKTVVRGWTFGRWQPQTMIQLAIL
jgi:hypothetical protein